ncbi:MAG: hypothetical protein R3F17_08285 [Planctomycetota bacterium]
MDTTLITTLLYIIFAFSAIVLIVVILLQEGKVADSAMRWAWRASRPSA